MDSETKVHELKEKIKAFCEQRNWNEVHTAKELAIGMITESAELLEHFRFKSEEQVEEMFLDKKKKAEIEEEIGDLLLFLLRFCQKYDIDITTEFHKKLEKTEKKYPSKK